MEIKQSYLKRKSKIPVLILLAVFTLLSPCTVGKALQAQFDIPVTKKLNPSKTALASPAQCEYSDYGTAINPGQKNDFEQAHDFLPFSSISLLSYSQGLEHQSLSISTGWCIVSKIPIYILYKKMKLWV